MPGIFLTVHETKKGGYRLPHDKVQHKDILTKDASSLSHPVVDVIHLQKTFGKGQAPALNDVTFSVQRGSCFGLLGPNGAGKSTTMKILTGIVQATNGHAMLFDKDATKNTAMLADYVGYVPQEITLYKDLSAYDNLYAFGQMYGLRGQSLKDNIADILYETGLTDKAKKPNQNLFWWHEAPHKYRRCTASSSPIVNFG